SEHAHHKRSAAGMHRTQFGENSLFARIPEEFRIQFYGEERFFRARPGGQDEKPESGISRLLALAD
ncbi:MAG: hypothetical protein KC482_02730, partial [Dehalococcoidia bacterium]|nr:hypothetical protein [Dehalococcoidia bacterium]